MVLALPLGLSKVPTKHVAWSDASRSSSFTSAHMGDRVEISWEPSLVSNGSSGTTVETALDFCLGDSLSSSTFGVALPTFPLGTEINRTVSGSVGGCLLFSWLFFGGLDSRETACTMYAARLRHSAGYSEAEHNGPNHLLWASQLRSPTGIHPHSAASHHRHLQPPIRLVACSMECRRHTTTFTPFYHSVQQSTRSGGFTLAGGFLLVQVAFPLQDWQLELLDVLLWSWDWHTCGLRFKKQSLASSCLHWRSSRAISIEKCLIARGFIRFTRSLSPKLF